MKIYQYVAAITLSVGAVQSAFANPWPTAVADRVTVNTNQRVYIPVLANDLGNGLRLTEVNARSVSRGSVEMNGARNALYYRSADGFQGNDSFWYAFKDSQGRTNSTQVFVKVISFDTSSSFTSATTSNTNTTTQNNYSGWPAANVDNVTTSVNRAITIPVLANDIGDRLSLTGVNNWSVKGGRASISGDSISYTPKSNYVGQDSFWYNIIDARGRKNSTQAKITITGDSGTTATNDGGSMNTDAVRIPMHFNFLKNQYAIWNEVGGTRSTRVTRAARAGSYQINISGGITLRDNQLISYLATNGQYYTVAISRNQGNTITLRTPLPAAVAQGSNVWNFYRDGAHPNTIGYRSLVDFVMRNNDASALNSGRHVLLGDSWFANNGIRERLANKLPRAQIINKGIGGNTAASLLARFDRDVASQNPDVVWVITGTNDYYRGVSVSAYQSNMRKLLQKIDAIGAKAMVFDSSVAPLMAGGNTSLTQKSHQYSRALENLFNQ